MIFFAAFFLLFSLVVAWNAVSGRVKHTARVLRLILASCIFFSSFFLLVQQLAAARYISIVREPWLASLSSETSTISLNEGEKISVSILIENQGTETFDSALKNNPVFLSFHILDESGQMHLFENLRFAFAEPLRPKQQQVISAVLDAALLKLVPGRYFAEFDLVREGAFWFAANSRAAHPLCLPLNVGGASR